VQGLVLLQHGIFTFADDAKTAYERMIEFVTMAEERLQPSGPQVSRRRRRAAEESRRRRRDRADPARRPSRWKRTPWPAR